MRRTIEITTCDLCKEEKPVKEINYPIIFTTEQTEGRSVTPYISQAKLEVCDECIEKICKITAVGAQGCNTYRVK